MVGCRDPYSTRQIACPGIITPSGHDRLGTTSFYSAEFAGEVGRGQRPHSTVSYLAFDEDGRNCIESHAPGTAA
jgi:hypothetical protein